MQFHRLSWSGDPTKSRLTRARGIQSTTNVGHWQLDQERPESAPHAKLIQRVTDRPGHDRRYAIDPSRISTELGWQPRHNVEEGLAETVSWYLSHQDWCQTVREKAGYDGGRLGINQAKKN